jgi:eukaryotic-like serine/threonine-protein kinase
MKRWHVGHVGLGGACLTLLLILLAFAISACGPGPEDAAMTPKTTAPPAMFRADPAHTGVYPDTGASITGQLAWKFKTGGWVGSSPAVSGGVVYVGNEDYMGNGDQEPKGDYLYALDAATGTLRWKFKAGDNFVDSSPAVSGGLVYVGSDDHYLYAVK